MFEDYLKQIGLDYLIKDLENKKLNNFVEEIFEQKIPKLSKKEIKDLYAYDVPKLSADGSCSILEEKAGKPYDLSEIFAHSPFNDLFFWRLKQIVKKIHELTKVDWFGIYKKTLNPKNEPVLVKLSYLGLFSRAEFLLTKEFAKKSNNSSVGLTGKAIVIQNVNEHNGAYYKCDGKVQSEFCLPILDSNNEVLGIIDAEAFPTNFFANEKLLQIAKVAYDFSEKF